MPSISGASWTVRPRPGASTSTYLRGDMTWAAVPAGVAGSSGDLQFNNAGVLAGAADWTYLSGGVLYSSLTGSAPAIVLNSNGVDYGQLGTVSSTQFGLCYGVSLTTLGTCPLEWGSGGVTIGGTLSLGTLNISSAATFPDGSGPSSTYWRVGSNTGPGNGLVFQADSPSTFPIPPITGHGAGVIGVNPTAIPLGPAGEYYYAGLTIQGWVAPASAGCSPYCSVNDVTLMDHSGNPVAAVQTSPTTTPWPFLIGATRTVAPTAVDEGYPVGQLFLGDVVPSGLVEGPLIIWQPGPSQAGSQTGPAFVGLGRADTTTWDMRLGPTENEVTPWDDTAADQPNFDLAGCLKLGSGNSSGGFDGGSGVSWHELLCDNAGVATFYSTSKSANEPIAASFYRTTPTTVSGLSGADPTPSVGDRAVVTDAMSCTFNSTVSGGGSVKCPVVYTGSWVAG